MDAKELRIGNWVSTPMGESQIRQADLSDESIKDSILQPIPLTIEWLNRMFEHTNGVSWSEDKDWYGFAIGDHDGVWDAEYNGHYLRDIEYVHEAQNLYYAIKGEELTINQ